MDVMARLALKRAQRGDACAPDVGAVNPPPPVPGPVAAEAPGAPVRNQPEPAQMGLFIGQPHPPEPQEDRTAFPPSAAEMQAYAQEQAQYTQEPALAPTLAGDAFALPTLYVGCLPLNEACTLLEQWLAPLVAEVAASLGASYYESGRSSAALAASLRQKVQADGLPQALVVDPRLPTSSLALEVLRPYYCHPHGRSVLRVG